MVGGSHPGEGNVIINGRPVCDDLWDKRDADVVCRMIGFVSGQAVTNSAFGQVATTVLLRFKESIKEGMVYKFCVCESESIKGKG